jgi:hypothetical protein
MLIVGDALIGGGFEGTCIGFASEKEKDSLDKCAKMRLLAQSCSETRWKDAVA